VTLLELLIVIAIMGVMVAIGVVRLESARYAADANVRLIRSQLQLAQRRALQQQHDVIVSFEIAGNRIRILEDLNNSGSADAGEPVQWRALSDNGRFVTPGAGISGPAVAPVTGDNLRTIDAMPSVVFHRSGSASTSLEVYLRVSGRRDDFLRGVTLLQSTGRTEWYRYAGSIWHEGRT
jgi:Tfp pilus assembly protein FimT